MKKNMLFLLFCTLSSSPFKLHSQSLLKKESIFSINIETSVKNNVFILDNKISSKINTVSNISFMVDSVWADNLYVKVIRSDINMTVYLNQDSLKVRSKDTGIINTLPPLKNYLLGFPIKGDRQLLSNVKSFQHCSVVDFLAGRMYKNFLYSPTAIKNEIKKNLLKTLLSDTSGSTINLSLQRDTVKKNVFGWKFIGEVSLINKASSFGSNGDANGVTYGEMEFDSISGLLKTATIHNTITKEPDEKNNTPAFTTSSVIKVECKPL